MRMGRRGAVYVAALIISCAAIVAVCGAAALLG